MYFLNFIFFAHIPPLVNFLDYMVGLFLVFRGTSILFSIEAVSIYIPTNSVGGVLFLHIFSDIYL